MENTLPAQECSFACHLPGGLCIHQIRTKAKWAFTFENPAVFYFLPAPSQHFGKEMFCGGKFHRESILRPMAQPLGHSLFHLLLHDPTVGGLMWLSKGVGEGCGTGGSVAWCHTQECP